MSINHFCHVFLFKLSLLLTYLLFVFLQGQILKVRNDKTIKASNFDPQKKTKFIIHGFIDTPLANWVKVSTKRKLD